MSGGEFLYKVAAICFRWQCSVTSWIRSRAHNEAVGGHPNSLHIWGLAVDIVPDNWDDLQWILADIRDAGLHYKVESDHIHIQAKPARKR